MQQHRESDENDFSRTEEYHDALSAVSDETIHDNLGETLYGARENYAARNDNSYSNQGYTAPAWQEIESGFNDDTSSYTQSFSPASHNSMGHRAKQPRKSSVLWQFLGVFAELLIMVAFICGLYIVWQMWWTGVEAEQAQEKTLQSASWPQPSQKDTSIAPPQQGKAPAIPKPTKNGELIAQIFIPRFGSQWHRNIVQGVDRADLNLHGLGHYSDTQLPGQLGNFALAGHRNGYGQPLGDIDKLKPGDPIIIRTKDYWYIYHFTHYKIVKPEDVFVVSPNPDHPNAQATQDLITLTTCEPKYSAPTHRWISWGDLDYWAKVSDGIPRELATKDASGAVHFINNEQPTWAAKSIHSLPQIMLWIIVTYAIIFLAAAVVWRWPKIRAIRLGQVMRPDVSILGTILRYQPGPKLIRGILGLLLLALVSLALLQWGYPWAASHIPYLQQLSNYVVEN